MIPRQIKDLLSNRGSRILQSPDAWEDAEQRSQINSCEPGFRLEKIRVQLQSAIFIMAVQDSNAVAKRIGWFLVD
jgi:hypothetical protein